MHVPILLFNLMKVYNVDDEDICLSDLITKINTVDHDKLIDQLLINDPRDSTDSDLIFRDAIQAAILPFLIDYSGPTVGQILNTHTSQTINIITDIIENYYFFGAIELDDFFGFTYVSEDTIAGELKNKLLVFEHVINEFDGLCVFGEDQQLEKLFIDHFGLSRINLILQILNLLTCDQSNIVNDKYRLIAINKLLNILQNDNSEISSDVTTKFEYLRDSILNANDLSSLKSWITTLKDDLASLGPFTPVDNQTVVNVQSNVTIGSLNIIAGSNYFGTLGDNIYVRMRVHTGLKKITVNEDVPNRIITLTIASNIATTVDEVDVLSALNDNNVELIDVNGVGTISISDEGNYKLSGGVNVAPPVMCGLSQNITNNDTFLYYLIDYINDAGCSLHPDTLTYVYPPENMTLSFCLSGTEVRYRSIHDYQLEIIKARSAENIIDGVYYQAKTPGVAGDSISVEIIDQVGSILISVIDNTIEIRCDVSSTKQTDIVEAINNNSNAFDLVTASGGSTTENVTVTAAALLSGGLDAEFIYNYQEYLDLTDDQIESTLITDNESLLTITDDNEKQFGFIDISTAGKFPLQESGFKIFLPEGCSGLYMRLGVSGYQDVPYIIGKYRYAPTRYEIDNYTDYVTDVSFKTIKDRGVFVESGSEDYVTVISSRGLPLMTSLFR
jgi:hypothetical protein